MKNKKVIIWTIVLNVMFILLFGLSLYNFTSFDYSETISKEQFTNTMSEVGCSTIDVTEEYEKTDFYLITDADTCPYLINYVSFSNVDDLNNFSKDLYTYVINENNNVTGNTNINIMDEFIELSTYGDKFNIMTINQNTILFTTVDSKYYDEIIDIYSKLNYHYVPNYNGYIFIVCLFIIFSIFTLVCFYKIKKKIDNKGWLGLIPVVNYIELTKDVYGSYLYNLLFLIPFVNFITFIRLFYKLGKTFGKSTMFSILLIFFPSLLLPIIAFDESEFKRKIK